MGLKDLQTPVCQWCMGACFLLPYLRPVGVTPSPLWCDTNGLLVSHQRTGAKNRMQKRKNRVGREKPFAHPLLSKRRGV